MKKPSWGIFISIICRHKIKNRTYMEKCEKNNIEIVQNGLPSPRGPPRAYLMSPNQGAIRTYQLPFTE